MSKKKPKPSEIRIPPDRADEEVDESTLADLLESGPPPEDEPKTVKSKPKK